MQPTDAELRRLLAGHETERLELKESLGGDARKKIAQAICAFANDLSGSGEIGLVVVGLRDDGSPSGVSIGDEQLRTLGGMKSDGRIVPPPSMSVEKRELDGVELAVVVVAPSDTPPVRFEGRIWIRTGPRRGLASAQDERILNERRRYLDAPFDIRPVRAAGLGDLRRALFEGEYLPAAVAPDVLAANDRTYEQRLAASKMIASAEDPIPTVLGILTLCARTRDFLPCAYVQFLRVDGKGLGDAIVDESEIDGALFEILTRIDEKLEAHNRTAVDLTSGNREVRRPDYPKPALQQLVRNAVMHRTYEGTNAPIRVTWYDDRIEILSPGGPFGTVGPENFGEPGVTDYRNPNLAEAMRVLSFVQRFGVGIATARKLLEENGNPQPEFVVQPTTVSVTVRRRL